MNAELDFKNILRSLNIRSESPSGTKGDEAVQAAIDECYRLCPDFKIWFGVSNRGNPVINWGATHAGKRYGVEAILSNLRTNPALLRSFFFNARDALRQVTNPQQPEA